MGPEARRLAAKEARSGSCTSSAGRSRPAAGPRIQVEPGGYQARLTKQALTSGALSVGNLLSADDLAQPALRLAGRHRYPASRSRPEDVAEAGREVGRNEAAILRALAGAGAGGRRRAHGPWCCRACRRSWPDRAIGHSGAGVGGGERPHGRPDDPRAVAGRAGANPGMDINT